MTRMVRIDVEYCILLTPARSAAAYAHQVHRNATILGRKSSAIKNFLSFRYALSALRLAFITLGHQALLNLGIDLPAGETFELSAGGRTGGRTGSAPLANHFVDLADFLVLQVLNGLIGTYLEASLTAHTGLWIDSRCNGIAKHRLL